MNKNDDSVGTGLVGAPACGDVMKLQVISFYFLNSQIKPFFRDLFLCIYLTHYCFLNFKIKVDENGRIVDAKFKTFGCGSAIASSSLATEWVKGKTVSITN